MRGERWRQLSASLPSITPVDGPHCLSPPSPPHVQAGLKAEKLRRFAELDAQHQRQLSDERIKLGRLAGLQLAPGPVRRPSACAAGPVCSAGRGICCSCCNGDARQSQLAGEATEALGALAGSPSTPASYPRHRDPPFPPLPSPQDGKEPLLSYLMQRHGMRGKLYKNKDAAALARTAAAMQAARSACKPPRLVQAAGRPKGRPALG